MSLYDKLNREDLVQYFEDQFNTGEIRFDSKGNLKAFKRLTPDIPWLFTKEIVDTPVVGKCSVYQTFFAMKMGFIHSACHECYKVVVKPKTVVQLMKLRDLQVALKLPSKCGIETRSFVPRLYGGYFYARGLEEGRKLHELVSKRVKERIDGDIEVILKRGCTEFEMKFGPSDKWEIIPEQYEVEKEFFSIYSEDMEVPVETPKHLEAYIKKNWLKWAASATPPDLTYKEYTGGKKLALTCEYITYHEKGKE